MLFMFQFVFNSQVVQYVRIFTFSQASQSWVLAYPDNLKGCWRLKSCECGKQGGSTTLFIPRNLSWQHRSDNELPHPPPPGQIDHPLWLENRTPSVSTNNSTTRSTVPNMFNVPLIIVGQPLTWPYKVHGSPIAAWRWLGPTSYYVPL